MLQVRVKDLFWGYFTDLFVISSGIITLPLVLSLLTEDEIGMNYLMLSIATIVSLIDFGFTPQLSRNLTYIFSGADKLKKEGVYTKPKKKSINYKLLSLTIKTSKIVYQIIATISFILMVLFGTIYINIITDGFSTVENSLSIWLIFCFSTFFNIYYSYYFSLLLGRGMIMESKRAQFFSKFFYVFLTVILLLNNFGLISIVISNLISPFVGRYIAYKAFFKPEISEKIDIYKFNFKEKKENFLIIFYNAKKLGLVFIGAFAVSKLSIFLAGLYLNLNQIASFGLMIQLFAVISMFSSVFFNVFQPRLASLRIKKNISKLKTDFAFCMNMYYLSYTLLTIFLILFSNDILNLIGSNVDLPNSSILILFSLIIFLEGNHSNFASFITTENKVPFVIPALISGLFIAIGTYVSLQFTSSEILGIIIVQGFVQLCYNNWKWPFYVLNELNISFKLFIIIGLKESFNKFLKILK